MTEAPTDRCGYTYDARDSPAQQHCCYRETVSDADRCPWHVDPAETSEKTLETLQKTRSRPEEIAQVQREESRAARELLDGANISELNLGDALSFRSTSLRDADLSGTNFNSADFTAADLRGADLTGTDLSDATLTDAVLSKATLTDARLTRADLSGAVLLMSTLTDASLLEATLTDAYLFSGTDLRGVNFAGADLTGAALGEADLTGANLGDADLTDASLERADLTDTILAEANLTRANAEQALLVRANLFGTDLTDSRLHGATLTDAQINHDTVFQSRHDPGEWTNRRGLGLFTPKARCAYDPKNQNQSDEETPLQALGKAADMYQTLEKLARENALPALQSEMFVLRQDMQRKRHWLQRDYFNYAFARTSRTLFKYGESLARIFTWALIIIFIYAGVYAQFEFITDGGGEFITDPIDALYFSTLTFTTLGLGDFQPSPTSEIARALVTTQAALGAILIAIFVFVLGRRAAR